MSKEKIYFTSINEDEKMLLNIVRTFIEPHQIMDEFIDHQLQNIVNTIADKAVEIIAIRDSLQTLKDDSIELSAEDKSSIRLFQDYKEAFKERVQDEEELLNSIISIILKEIINIAEGEVVELKEYNNLNAKKEVVLKEKTILDKALEL